ncbi:MAG TPA: DUF1049 domain-containing protein [bacterium]|nr:DUF1049 domain-containing protein [bacterium]
MKRIIYLIILMLVVFWLAIFVAVNLHEVEIKWFFGKTWGMAPLIVIILGSILLGALLAALTGGISQAKLLSQNRKQKKTIMRLEEELTALRKLPVEELEKEIREAEEPECR